MAFLLQNVIKFGFDEIVVLDLHEYAFDIFLLLIADVPLAFCEILRRYFEPFAEVIDLLGCRLAAFVALGNKCLQLLLGVVLADAEDGEVQCLWALLDLIGVGLNRAERTAVGRIDDVDLLRVDQHFHDGILGRKH